MGDYSRGVADTLPTDTANLTTLYDATDKSYVATDDDTTYVGQGGSEEYMLHEFKVSTGGKKSGTITWDGKSNIDCTKETTTLEIYNYYTGLWEYLDSDNSTGANTDFTLTNSIADLTNYVSGGEVTCRVYQYAKTVGNVYYMRADGVATQSQAMAGNGGSPDNASTAMSVATHNAGSFQPGDTIYLSNQGGNYSIVNPGDNAYCIIVPSSGSDGNPIYYKTVVGENPVIDGSHDIGTSGWTFFETNSDGYDVYYKYSAARVFWVDGVAQLAATSIHCTGAGTWYFYPQETNNNIYYKVPHGANPSDHSSIRAMWFASWQGDPFSFNACNRSNLDISGITFNYLGMGTAHDITASVDVTKNIKIHNNNFNYCFTALRGWTWNSAAHPNVLNQDVEISYNNFNYCNEGIQCWGWSNTGGVTGEQLRINVHHNTVDNLFSVYDPATSSSSLNWRDALPDPGFIWVDHEGISFMNGRYIRIEDNEINEVVTTDTTYDAYFTRAIYFFTSVAIGHVIQRNRINGTYNAAIFMSNNLTDNYTEGYENCIVLGNVMKTAIVKSQNSSIIVRCGQQDGSRVNYMCNNTVNNIITNTGSTSLGIGSDWNGGGNWTFANNIVNAAINAIATTPTSGSSYTFLHNNYNSNHPEKDIYGHPFKFNGTNYVFSQWNGVGLDTDGTYSANDGSNDPGLNADSAITTSSPTQVRTGGDKDVIAAIKSLAATISAAQWPGNPIVITGIDGEEFDPDTPAMGAYAVPVAP